jgi:hypothetical protein
MKALGSTGRFYASFQPGPLCRVLAKIAHAYTVAELGREAFDGFLPDVVLGTNPDIASYVGNLDYQDPETDELHTLSFATMEPFIVVRVRLYARHGGPSYAVVSGRKRVV